MKNYYLDKKNAESIQQLSGYGYQCVAGEVVKLIPDAKSMLNLIFPELGHIYTCYQLERQPVKGTVTGKVIADKQVVQTFSEDVNGQFVFATIDETKPYIKYLTIYPNQAQMNATWSDKPNCEVVVSYEYGDV